MKRCDLALLVLLLAPAFSATARVARIDTVEDAEILFSHPERQEILAAGLSRASVFWGQIQPHAARRDVPADLFFGLAMVESSFNPYARSRCGAEGMWQFMPRTARSYGLHGKWSRFDVESSTSAAARHLRDLHRQFKSWDLALAAYNAGAGRVRQAISRAGSRRWSDVRVNLRAETHDFVPKVRYVAEQVYPRFVRDYRRNPPMAAIRVPRGATWHGLAGRYCTTVETLQRLNGSRLYANAIVVVPVRRYVIRSGDSLWGIARRFRVDLQSLLDLNSLNRTSTIFSGRTLLIPAASS